MTLGFLSQFALLFTPFLALGLLGATPPPTGSITTEQLTSRMTKAIEGLTYLRCNVKAQERLGTQIRTANSAMKISFNPFRVYIKNPDGVELLWVKGQNDGDAWVYPGSFPYVTLSLDPKGAVMRRNQHHTTFQAGFGTIADLLQTSATRQDNGYVRSFRYVGDTTLQSRTCHILRSDFPQFRYVAHKVSKNETIASIADKFGCGEFRIMERNKLSVGDKLAEGSTLQVPNAYGRRVILCIDPKTYLPTVVQVNDDRGMYEKFEFSNVVPNQPIPLEEFTKGYKGYKL